MKIWFCQGCGTRVTETDLKANLGEDKLANSVCCVQCESSVQTDKKESTSNSALKSIRSRPARSGVRTLPRGSLAVLAKDKKAASGFNRIPTHAPFITKRMSIVSLVISILLLLTAILFSQTPAREAAQGKLEQEKSAAAGQPGRTSSLPPVPFKKYAETKAAPAPRASVDSQPGPKPPIFKGDAEQVRPSVAAGTGGEIPEGFAALWKFRESEGWDVWWPGSEARPFSASTTANGYAIKIESGASELSLPVFSPLYKTRKSIAETPEALTVDVDLQEGAASIELYLLDSQQEVLQYSRRKLDAGVNRVTWKMRSDFVASGGPRTNKMIDGPAFLWEMRLIRPAGGAAIKAVFQSAYVRESKARAEADAPATPLWNFDLTEKWAPWWPDDRGKQPFRIERTAEGLKVSVDPQEKELRFTLLESRYRSDLTLGSPQYIALDADVTKGKKVMLGLNIVDKKKEGFELEGKELKSGPGRVIWNLNRDCVRSWGEKQTGQIDNPINLWDLQIDCPASKEQLEFTLKRATKG